MLNAEWISFRMGEPWEGLGMSDEEADRHQQAQPIITQDAQLRWVGLPTDRPISIPLRTTDLDHLFLAIRSTILGQHDLGIAMLHISHQNLEAAQKSFDASQEHTRNAMSHIDQLIVHAMATAEPI